MSKGLTKVFLTILILNLSGLRTTYAQNIVLKDPEKSYPLTHPLFLVDPENNLEANQLPDRKNFKPSKFPTLSLGATTASVWVKTRILNQSNKTDWHIQVDSPPVLQSVSVYQKRAGSLIKIFTSYADKPKATGEVRVNNLLIPISIPIHTEAEFYIQASSNNILRLPIKVITLQNAFEQSHLSDLLNGIVFGMLMAFAIYNFFVYILTKEQPYLYYLGYIFFWSLNLFFYNGFLPDILSSLIWLNSAGTIIAIASLLSIFFTNSFLQTKKNSPFFYKIRGQMCLLSLLILLTDIFWKGAYSFILVQYLMYPYFIYWFGAGVQSLRNGYKPAIYFILGFGLLMLGNAVYNLKDLNILPDNLFTRTSMHWGTLLEALILSFALANRLNFYRKQQELIQLKTIEEKRAFLKELLQRQEQEKKRVAMELHDNIGQQLILIKNRSWRLQQLSEAALKNQVSGPIAQVATIMAEVRGILHRLRPYQMDLLGLTQSIHGLITDTFADHHLEQGKTDEINQHFSTDESIHIFRILQLLTDGIMASKSTQQIRYAIIRQTSSVDFQFDLQDTQQPLGNSPDIHNRLELLKGSISVHHSQSTTQIKVNIPFTQ
ncbi:7TM diverse intracellular signaling domain-containing protein [Pedobacter sp. B4-66]|uniref:sensor histidine kinase n=1 Tax=Pedobacter sp. B4-66 TaxID=2817280 RepID=UPI001BDA11F3|nr:7TM diverse intracellular signaling domain-containing protein [Pedobacter sp. B4-66]